MLTLLIQVTIPRPSFQVEQTTDMSFSIVNHSPLRYQSYQSQVLPSYFAHPHHPEASRPYPATVQLKTLAAWLPLQNQSTVLGHETRGILGVGSYIRT